MEPNDECGRLPAAPHSGNTPGVVVQRQRNVRADIVLAREPPLTPDCDFYEVNRILDETAAPPTTALPEPPALRGGI